MNRPGTSRERARRPSLSATAPGGWLGGATWKTARFRTAGALRTLAESAGLSVTMIRGAVYYPPIGKLARILAPLDPWLGRVTTYGAAFVALQARAAGDPPVRQPSPAGW